MSVDTYASQIMNAEPVTVTPDTTVEELAGLLLVEHLDGVVVLDGQRLVGVVTAMDLVRREATVDMHPYLTVLDRLMPGGGERKQARVDRMVGTTVSAIMSPKPRTVKYDADIGDVASLMVDEHITVVPVVRDGRLVGVITKPDILAAALRQMLAKSD